MSEQIEFISAGAGSGKTYKITHMLSDLLAGPDSDVRPAGVIATTFTKKAANELVERVRLTLAQNGQHALATQMGQARIGTVNSVCGHLLEQFAFEAGLSPRLDVLDEDASKLLFSQSLDEVVSNTTIRKMNALAKRLDRDSWQQDLKDIVDLARANGIEPPSLGAQATQSLESLMAFFPKATSRDLNKDIKTLVDQALLDVKANTDDTTKKTADYVSLLESFGRDLAYDSPQWGQWLNLCNKQPGAKSQALAQPVADLATLYEHHPGLHADLRAWIEGLYSIAADALTAYHDYKAQRGMIDFVDQERLLLNVLDKPEVRSVLAEQLDLLMVDEFQDTSPIQLALFLKLAALANRTVWVGDIKQAIYGFRGSDPALMTAVLEHLQNDGISPTILPTSYRSRPGLVHLANNLFTPAFANYLTEEQVKLLPDRKDLNPRESSLEFWNLQGSNKPQQALALADGIARLFTEKRQVIDKHSEELRPLRYSDVAILSRTNANIGQFSEALTTLGLPVSIRQAGLLKTPEAALALACLRRLADQLDTLASAEIIALGTSRTPEEWLTHRLEYLEAGHEPSAWGIAGTETVPVLQRLAEERQQLSLLSPSEALDRAIWAGEVERTIRLWGPTEQRSAQRLVNLEALRGYAQQYEDQCRQYRSAATVGGLLLWLYALADAELDEQGQDPTVDAIQILTHHRAKGLEWPVVICADLDAKLKGRIWQPRIVTERQSVSFADPLAGRQIRTWVHPFGRKSANIGLFERVEASPEWDSDQQGQLAEAKRLLYVSMTRARDLLILPINTKLPSQPWLDCLDASWLLPQDGPLVLPDGETVACRVRDLAAPESWAPLVPQKTFNWFPKRAQWTAKQPAHLQPSGVDPLASAQIARNLQVGQRLVLTGTPPMNVLGTACHDVIATLTAGGRDPQDSQWVKELLERYDLAGVLDPVALLAHGRDFQKWLIDDLGATAIYPEWPIRSILSNGQVLNGWIDLLIDTPGGWVIIDHKSFPGAQSEWDVHALGYSGQLAVYRDAMIAATGRAVVGLWIHYCLGGGAVEIDVSE